MEHPKSDVSVGTGLVGAVCMIITLAVLCWLQVPAVTAALIILVGAALPTAMWSLLVDKVHLRASTGLDYSLDRPLSEIFAIVKVKMIGLAATFALIALTYWCLKFYWQGGYELYFVLLAATLPALFCLAPVYVWFTSRYMTEPRDGLWHFGKLVCFDFAAVDREQVNEHLRSWIVKTFFLDYMVVNFPGHIYLIQHTDVAKALTDPAILLPALIRLAFIFDMCFGTIGYILTVRVLDAHIRSTNPYFAGWAAALICYPPFTFVRSGGPLDYHSGGHDWMFWFAHSHVLFAVWGTVMVALVFIYASATVIFGFRFSNLTNRGIITNGPYYFFKHPAYLAKNIFWWMAFLPFLSTASPADAVRNSVALLIVNAIYYARAKTEEKHLMADPKYQDYANWIAEHGLLQRAAKAIGRAVRGHRKGGDDETIQALAQTGRRKSAA
jgi:Isoprenylcysteine carboxyl methyltransferase (ICMT) family